MKKAINKVKNNPNVVTTILNVYSHAKAEFSGASPAVQVSSWSKTEQRENSTMQIPKE